jgi:hypothetical protein
LPQKMPWRRDWFGGGGGGRGAVCRCRAQAAT